MIKKIDEKKFYIWFLALTSFLIGFLVGYSVAFNKYVGVFFDNFQKPYQSIKLKNKTPQPLPNLPLPSTSDKNNQSSSPKNQPLSDEEKKLIQEWILKSDLNEFGDSKDTMYTGGTPLFDESTGQSQDLYEYILKNQPDRPWLNLKNQN
jgi:hypothetical protein